MYYSISQNILENIRRVFVFFLLLLFLSFQADQSEASKNARNPPFEELRMLGYSRQQDGDLDGALALYLRAAALDPQPNVLNDLGVIYEQLGFPDRAQAMYEEALATDLKYLPAIMNLAYLSEKKGDIARFIELLRRRIAAGDPDDEWTQKAREELVGVYERFPEFKQKLVDEQRAELENTLNEQARINRENELKSRMSEAEKYFERGVKLFKTRKYPEAIQQFDQAIDIVPSNEKYARARDTAVKEYRRQQVQNDFSEAMQHFDMGDEASAQEKIRSMLTHFPEEPVPVGE